MSLPTYCPQCRTIRQPNGVFCHMCGYNYVVAAPKDSTPVAIPAQAYEARLSIGSGFRFGLGFVAAVLIGGVIFSVLSSVLFAAVLGSILGSFTR